MKTSFKKSIIALFIVFSFFSVFKINNVFAGEPHKFEMQAYDWDPLEETGTEDEYENGAQIDPGRVIKLDIYYTPGDGDNYSFQYTVNYDSNLVEPLMEEDDEGQLQLYYEDDITSIGNGGMWPNAGTTNSTKKKTNWTQTVELKASNSRINVVTYDGKQNAPMSQDGVILSLYFKVKSAAQAGETIRFSFDNSRTKIATEGVTISTSGLELSVFGEMAADPTLETLTVTGNNSLEYLEGFTAGTTGTTYNIVVPNAVSSITIAATSNDENGAVLPGGLGSKSLNVGTNSFTVTGQAQDGTQENYILNIYRLNNNDKLSALSLSGVTLNEAFSSTTYKYTATVPYATTSTTISATVSDTGKATLTGTGAFTLSKISPEKNTATITVKAEDCDSQYSSVPGNSCTSKDYVVEVTREEPSHNADLKEIKIDGTAIADFSKNTISYTLENVANNKESLLVSATVDDTGKATVTGVGTKALSVGSNTIELVVTAEDGTTTKTYTITVKRLDNNANLKSLTVTSTPAGTFSPNFESTFYNYYTYTYEPTVKKIMIEAEADSTVAQRVIGTGEYSSGVEGANITVIAEDGSSKTYVIKFSRKLSPDATLKSLSIEDVSLNETFNKDTTLYTATVAGTVSSINITAVPTDDAAEVISGNGPHTLNYGTNTIQIRVKAENGSTKDYTITVTRNKKTIALLEDLKVDGTTVPDFNELKQTYDLGTVPFNQTSIDITATVKTGSDATLTGTGEKELSTGQNEFKVIVTAQDGTTQIPYTIKVFRTLSDNTNLATLTVTGQTLDQTVSATTKDYTLTVPYEVSSITINATAEYPKASLAGSGTKSLNVGDNNFAITIVAEDGDASDTYNLKVTRQPSTNKDLASLSVKNGTTEYLTGFSSSNKTYNITVPYEVDEVTISATGAQPLIQTVTGTGSKTLNTGLNTFKVNVKAQNNDNVDYEINITRSLNANTNLKSLTLSDGYNFDQTFNKDRTSYTLSVGSDVSSITINAEAEETTLSTVEGTGDKTLNTGTNTFNVKVTAESGATKTYVIVITRQASNDSSLKSLSLTGATLNETFDKTTKSYTANVGNDVTEVTINAEANDPKAKGVTGTGTKTLNTGDNNFDIVVTAEDNTTTTYKVKVTRAKNTNADLKSLTLSDGYSFDQTFNKDTIKYTKTVDNDVKKLTISAEVEKEGLSTVTGTGEKTLSPGKNTYEIVVTAEDPTVTKTYTVEITRTRSSDKTLKTLTSTDGTISPTLTEGVKEYTLTVPYDVENANITAEATSDEATVNISKNTGLKVGDNNATVEVIAGDGTSETYTITITREPSKNNYLSSLSVKDAAEKEYIAVFSKNTTLYEINVGNEITTLDITAVAEDTANTTVTGTGEKTLSVGLNTFEIKATSASNETKTYTVKVTRSLNANAYLKSLTLSDGYSFDQTFDKDRTSYTLSVGSDVSSITINAEAEEKTLSTVEGTGEKTLNTGTNTFNVKVTAESGATKTYVIVITRQASNDSSLKSLSLTGATLNETFDKTTKSYTANVDNDVTEITINAEANDAKAKGVSGTGTKTLNTGDNDFNIVVTAENNTTTTYKVKVTRAKNTNADLKSLTLSDGYSFDQTFNKDTIKYTKTVDNDVKKLTISAEVEKEGLSTVTGTGEKTLSPGTNTYEIVVTAEDTTVTKTYTVEITRTRSSDTTLKTLTSTDGTISPTLTEGVKAYTLTVPYEIENANITAEATSDEAELIITGNKNLTVGDNYASIVVIAGDGSSDTFNVTITREPSKNNYLSSLSVKDTDEKEYIAVFSKNTTLYEINVGNEITTLDITAVAEDTANTTVTGTGEKTLSVGLNTFEIKATSASNETKTYTVKVTRSLNANANLKSLTLSDGYNFDQTFDKDRTSYTLSVGSDVSSITINAEAEEKTLSTVEGTGDKTLNTGTNTFNVKVTAESGATKTYVIVITRQASNDSSLKSLSINETILNETFDKETLSYTANVANTITEITINAEANDPKAKSVTGTGTKTLNTGDNDFDIIVTAEDNTTTTYKVKVTRAKNTNADLKSLTVSGGYSLNETFDKNTLKYTLTVPNSAKKILVNAEAVEAVATVSGVGEKTLSVGDNTIEVLVTAEDTSSKKKYEITITRLPSSDTTLTGISSTDGNVLPTFSNTLKEYTLTVPYEIEDANLTAETTSDEAHIVVSGNTGLSIGENRASILVVAGDGSTDTYYVTITRRPSTNNSLSGLSVKDKNNKQYITVFSSTTTTYEINVENDITYLVFAATPSDGTTTVKIRESEEETANENWTRDLNVGTNIFNIESTSASGDTKTYVVNVTRKANDNTDLKSLSVEGQTLSPSFSNDELAYSLTVNSEVASITINAEAEKSTSTVTGTGEKELHTGTNTFNITVKAESGATKTYVIVVTKQASNNNYLSSLTSSVGLGIKDDQLVEFNKEVTRYSVTVPNNVESITISAEAEHDLATVTGDGTFDLNVEDNSFLITVVAESNRTKVYTINVYREPSDNAYLSSLKLNDELITGFNKETISYAIEVENDVKELAILGEAEHPNANVIGNKTISLDIGINKSEITVIAENGSTKTYTINVTRKQSGNNYLSELSAAEGTLSPTFDKETLSYTMDVPYEATNLTLTATKEDESATIEIEGNTDFLIGSGNIVTVSVIAQNGQVRTYQINVTRLKQANNFLTELTIKSSNNKTYPISFNKNTLNYSVTLDQSDNIVIIDGKKEAASATVTGLEQITISSLPYVHKVTVTSASGVPRVYSITFNMVQPVNLKLKSLSIDHGTLTPDFNEDQLTYNVNVDSDVSSVTISAEAYNGMTVEGARAYDLNYGENIISIRVTDGTNSKIYTINVNRASTVGSTVITSVEFGHKIENGIIKTAILGETIEDLKNELDNENIKLQIWTSNGTTPITNDETLVATGQIVKLVNSSGEVEDTKVVVVLGDTDGNGKLTLFDSVKIVNHYLEKSALTGPALIAADVDKNNSITLFDSVKIVNHYLEKTYIKYEMKK